MAVVTMRQLLESGVHFGHQTRRWNPKMKRFIMTERNGIYIIDLQQSVSYINTAYEFVRETVAHGGTILFVGTKKQAQEIVELEARRTGSPYVTSRWLGGMLTNFKTIRGRVDRLNELDDLFETGRINDRPKAERIELGSERERLLRFVGGIRKMNRLPDAIFVVDPTKEVIAVQEANKLGIPVIALADTDSDPDVIDYIVPGNDDAIRSIQLITHRIGDLLVEARGGHEEVGSQAEQGDEGEAGGSEPVQDETVQVTSTQGRS